MSRHGSASSVQSTATVDTYPQGPSKLFARLSVLSYILVLCIAFATTTTPHPIETARTHHNFAEIVYLAHCHGRPAQHFLQMAYYSSDSDNENHTPPESTALVNDSGGGSGTGGEGSRIWEGEPVKAAFGSARILFTSSIMKGAEKMAVGEYVGSGGEGRCFKDSHRELYRKGDLICYAAYYCLDA